MVGGDFRPQPGPAHPLAQPAAERIVSAPRPRRRPPPACLRGQLGRLRLQQRLRHRHDLREDRRTPAHDPPLCKLGTRIAARSRCRRCGQISSRSQCRALSHDRATAACARANTSPLSAPERPARRATPAHRRCAATTSGTPLRSSCSSGWSASASSSHRPCRTHTRCQRGRYRTARTLCPVRRAVHNLQANAASPATALAARHRACARPASRPVLILGSSTLNAGRARASTAGSTPHSPASTSRPAALSTISASARTPTGSPPGRARRRSAPRRSRKAASPRGPPRRWCPRTDRCRGRRRRSWASGCSARARPTANRWRRRPWPAATP